MRPFSVRVPWSPSQSVLLYNVPGGPSQTSSHLICKRPYKIGSAGTITDSRGKFRLKDVGDLPGSGGPFEAQVFFFALSLTGLRPLGITNTKP